MQADLVRAFGVNVVMVVGLRLGCINHALLTARTVVADGHRLVGWIGNGIDSDVRSTEMIDTLRELIPAPCLGVVAHGQAVDLPLARAVLDAAIPP